RRQARGPLEGLLPQRLDRAFEDEIRVEGPGEPDSRLHLLLELSRPPAGIAEEEVEIVRRLAAYHRMQRFGAIANPKPSHLQLPREAGHAGAVEEPAALGMDRSSDASVAPKGGGIRILSRRGNEARRAQEIPDWMEIGAVEDPAQRALLLVPSEEHHGALEIRVPEARRREQQGGSETSERHASILPERGRGDHARTCERAPGSRSLRRAPARGRPTGPRDPPDRRRAGSGPR